MTDAPRDPSRVDPVSTPHLAVCVLTILLAGTTASQAAEPTPNRVPSGDFGQVRDGRPEHWGAYGNANKKWYDAVVIATSHVGPKSKP
jgi:hypothetical protein